MAQWAVTQGSRLLSLFAILQGVFIVLTEPSRWASPGFTYALAVPGAPPTWGWVILLAGLVSAYGGILHKLIYIVIGFYASAVWSFFFAGVFGKAFMDIPSSSGLGLIIFAILGVMYAGMAEVYRNTRKAYNATDRGDAGRP
jgi:hypothetical protein